MKYSDLQRLQKVLEYAKQLNEYILNSNIKKDDLLNKRELQWLVTTPLYNIGEHVYYMSDEYKDSHSDIQWKMISGLRHRLVHNYDGTNWSIIADVVFDELPALIKSIEKILNADTKTQLDNIELEGGNCQED